MIRIGLSFLLSFVLFIVQSTIIMQINQYDHGIRFNNYTHVAIVCILNFFIIFSILTQLKPWFLRINKLETEEENM